MEEQLYFTGTGTALSEILEAVKNNFPGVPLENICVGVDNNENVVIWKNN